MVICFIYVNAESIGIGIAILSKNCIGIGIANTF